ncbi:MAG TPA: hypothetical protein VNN22_14085 [Verrucomicrobiae bacterium]|nr:hypothetical protein [Verrucomicrobiae bacterium]
MMTSTRPRKACQVALAASIMVLGDPVMAALYSVRDLGVLTDRPGHNDSKPNAISRIGTVAAVNATNGAYQAFIYNGGWTNLGTLGGSNSFAFGVNASNQVAGRSLTPSGSSRAFLWTPGGTDGIASNPQMKDLGTLPGGTNSEADGINQTGQITGYAQTSAQASTVDHAFRYSSGTMTDIGKFNAMLPTSYGLNINDTGHIVGIAYDPSFFYPHAFFYNGSTLSDIGNLGMPGASALAINNSDHIAGYANVTNFFVHAFEYSGGVMQDLGTLGGDYSYAIGINNSNTLVGGSFVDASDSIYHAFIAVRNVLSDLNNQLDASGTGWELNEARAINDSGQIVGIGQFNGTNHAFLLNPVPEITNVKVIGLDVLISFTTINAAAYAVEYNGDLSSSSWSDLITNVIGNGGIETVTNSGAAGQPQRFYRVQLSKP